MSKPRPPREGPALRALLARAQVAVRIVAAPKIALAGAVLLLCLLLFAGTFIAASSSALGGGRQSCPLGGVGSAAIPAEYVPWLQRAAARYRLGRRGFAIVAAIHEVESDFGRSPLPGVRSGTNSAGAAGPGQFLASTWARYGVDANADGRRDVYGVPDSVFATANYLHASGAPRDWRAAIFAYNHAWWYVEEVLEVAASFEAGGAAPALTCEVPTAGPLGRAAPRTLARIEEVAGWIEARRIHYCWGGGHASQPGPSPGSYCWSASGQQVFGSGERGLDCSGAVRWLLVLSGFPDPGPLRSDQLGAAYPAGVGRQLTIWANIDHVFVAIGGRDWGTSSSNFASGPGFAPQSHAGFSPSHPPGL